MKPFHLFKKICKKKKIYVYSRTLLTFILLARRIWLDIILAYKYYQGTKYKIVNVTLRRRSLKIKPSLISPILYKEVTWRVINDIMFCVHMLSSKKICAHTKFPWKLKNYFEKPLFLSFTDVISWSLNFLDYVLYWRTLPFQEWKECDGHHF